jgi:predicted nucleic acid-binding protein
MTPIFVDTGGFFATFVEKDPAHKKALAEVGKLKTGKSQWITTDYVLDETATLLMARGFHDQAVALLELNYASKALQVEWLDSRRFEAAVRIFSRYSDQKFSFTDCTSFAIMKELKIRSALTTDEHFHHMGFKKLL